jgi:hypothetical protein
MSFVPVYAPAYMQPAILVQQPIPQPIVVQQPQPAKPLSKAEVIAQVVAVSCIALGVLGIVIGSSVGCPPVFILGVALAAVGLVVAVPAGIPIVLDYNIGWRRSYSCIPHAHYHRHNWSHRRF